ncbi:MAG: nascent polypeptide-associated complex protein [Candidatus Micrarchaeota archaeon]|nr:nascent polypeptide-associated complex protein [Candidatus Micrarchaeota archaeon]
MFPNLDPKKLKGMLDKLGIKSTEIASTQVVIHCNDKDIVVEAPQVTLIEGQGMSSFQISGSVHEIDRSKVEISDDDIKLVREQTGVEDTALIRKTLEANHGNIADAILVLKSEKDSGP